MLAQNLKLYLKVAILFSKASVEKETAVAESFFKKELKNRMGL